MAGRQLRGQVRQRGQRVRGGAHGPDGVVFMADRGAEHRHDGVTNELLHHAAMRRDRGRAPSEVAVDDHPHRLRVQPLRQRCRVHQVDEQDGDVFAGLVRGALADGQPRTAPGAEAVAMPARGATSSARHIFSIPVEERMT